MEYTVRSPLMYFGYFDRMDEAIPVPASDKTIKAFNRMVKDDNLAEYLDKSLKDVITSITFEAIADGEWCRDVPTDVNLYAHIETERELTEDEEDALIRYLEGQYSDGWMENGFEMDEGVFMANWDYYDQEPELEYV